MGNIYIDFEFLPYALYQNNSIQAQQICHVISSATLVEHPSSFGITNQRYGIYQPVCLNLNDESTYKKT